MRLVRLSPLSLLLLAAALAGCPDNGNGEKCDGGTCANTCATPCSPSDICLAGQCVPACPACPAGQVCARGACYPQACIDAPCAPNTVCFANACVPGDCAGVACPSGAACVNGACVSQECNGVTCGIGSVCESGQCVDHSCDNVRCAAGKTCVNGKCLGGCQGAGCSCDAGTVSSCYPYGAGLADPTLGKGICRSGTTTCNTAGPDGGLAFGACVDFQVPAAEETCNGIDDNCNGRADENCPIGITFTNGAQSALIGNQTGGSAFTAQCPSGQIARGVEIVTFSQIGVYAFKFICGVPKFDLDAVSDGGSPVTLDLGSNIGPFGWYDIAPANKTSLEFICPEGALSGFSGVRGADKIGSFVVRCTKLTVSGKPNALEIRPAAGAASTPPQANVGAGTAFDFSCPAPQVAGAFFGRAGAWIDAVGMRCVTPTLVLKP